ncbi:hypothetical protein JCM6292_396 [Bacteroides pyogenes JCM 6292]|uniref:Uncharacterized protein n=1 Tax=Bacteroides pyogenes JCM 6292 TaxID=1235809 RepID=W4P4G6_9BACE|nr:hypothetical protein JCM6292_396 [Bacteroides pyogenes JCM 6292]
MVTLKNAIFRKTQKTVIIFYNKVHRRYFSAPFYSLGNSGWKTHSTRENMRK